MVSRIISTLHTLQRLLLPPHCVLDAGPASRVDLADHLLAQLRPVEGAPHCRRCGLNGVFADICPRCRQNPPPFERVQAAFWLDETLKGLMHRMKYGPRPDLRVTRLLSELSSAHMTAGTVKALIPMPLHDDRLRQRGFNQAAWLARDWGRHFKLPVLMNAARRQRSTGQQARLNRGQRQRNMADAFTVSDVSLRRFGRVAIVDDVLTTGATAAALAQSIVSVAPDTVVEVWVVARTPLL